MKTPVLVSRFTNGIVCFALQILFVLLVVCVVTLSQSVQAAAYPYEITPATSIPNPATNVCNYTNINIPVSGNFTITDLNVGLNITHTSRADIDAKLTAPDGTSIMLFADVGGTGDHFDILLDDSNANDIASTIGTANHTLASPYYDKLYNPADTVVLSSFNGKNANGTWVLGICDDASATSGGIVNRVKLDFTGNAIVAPPVTIATPAASQVCKSTSVEQLDTFKYATAIGAGASGIPSMAYTAPTGSNRMMVVLLSVERDHTPVSNGRGDNFEGNTPLTNDQNAAPTVTFGGVAMTKNAFYWDSFGSSANAVDAEISRSYYLYTLMDLSIPSGAQTLQITSINSPKNKGDEAIIAAATFANVSGLEAITGLNDRTSPFNVSLTASPTATGTGGQPPGTLPQDNLLFAYGSSSKPEALTIGAGWTKLAEIPVDNTAGTYIGDTGRSQGIYTENDGHTLLIQSIKGVSSNQTALLSSTSTGLSGLGLIVARFVAHGCDYGDAPASYGDAFHSQSWSRRLGVQRGDAEIVTPLTAGAAGDDTNGLDDEDGIISANLTGLIAGQITTINTTVAGVGYLSAWFDWNGDGDFADAGEKIATDLQDTDADGTVAVPITIPLTATTAQTYARFRWSINTGVGVTGFGSYGEVEDYPLTIQIPSTTDYSDAPATYGDARHTIVNSIYLGTNPPDAETASKYSFNARADNNDDGAPSQNAPGAYIPLFPVLQLTDTSYSAGFKVTNTTGSAGKLYGWIDFDQSGTLEADEATSVNVPTGSNGATVTLNWATLPVDIKLGTTVIRLRLTTDSSVTTNTPTGNASNGEVEDYPIAVAMDIPPNSPSISIVSGATPAACETVVFQDNFNDLSAGIYWGSNRTGSQAIRNWVSSGGGNDTYAQTVTNNGSTAIYFGNGAVRQISPSIGTGFSFDANGKLLNTIDAIALRDNMDDTTPGTTAASSDTASDWGPEPVRFAHTFATTAGKTYRLYFKAIPEDIGGEFVSGIMRLDVPGGSIHFKAPGSNEGTQTYAVEFTATSASSTITFINYGHVENDNSGYCDPNSVHNTNAWCTPGGRTDAKHANELIIDDVVLTDAVCPSGTISGTVYTDSNLSNALDAAEPKLPNITVWLYDSTGTTLLQTKSTDASGAYSFTGVTVGTYQVKVDSADSDLPAGITIRTTNPLTGVAVTANNTTANQDFGFEAIVPACAAPATSNTGVNASIAWNHNPTKWIPDPLDSSKLITDPSTRGNPWPIIYNNALIASAADEITSNLDNEPTEWERYTSTSSVPATLTEAITGNK
jgi:subtilisin-like proprotein convertase family protein